MSRTANRLDTRDNPGRPGLKNPGRPRRPGRFLLLGSGLWLIGRGAALAQCAMCNTAARSSAVGWSLSVSILFMLAALSLVVGWLVLLIIRTSRSGRWRDGAATPVAPVAASPGRRSLR